MSAFFFKGVSKAKGGIAVAHIGWCILRPALALTTMILSGSMMLAVPAQAQQGDAAKGERFFRQCRACHQIGEGAKNSVGPNLTGVVGRPVGSFEGYNYGDGLKAANAQGVVWDADKIFEWLQNPTAWARKTVGDDGVRAKMTFMLSGEQQRRDVIAYLATFSDMAATDETADDDTMITHGDTPFDMSLATASRDTSTTQADGPLAGLERVRQTLVAPPFLPEHDQIAVGGPKIVEIDLTVMEKQVEIDNAGTSIVALTFNGSIPAPIIVVHEDDYVELTLTNPATNLMEHNIDLHAATGALGGAGLTSIMPGEQSVLRFKATKPGVFIYHCAPEGTMTPYHVTHGMNGAILVLPRQGLHDGQGNLLSYDRAYYIGEQDFYIPRDENGAYKSYTQAGEDIGDWIEVSHGLTPSHVVFNGRVGALTGAGAMRANVGETVLFLHSQANRDTRPHLIGGHGDYVWEEGSFSTPPERDLETWFIRGGSAGAALYTFRQPGVYAYLNHNLIEAVELGAAGHVVVEGEWDDDLMSQVYHGPIRQ